MLRRKPFFYIFLTFFFLLQAQESIQAAHGQPTWFKLVRDPASVQGQTILNHIRDVAAVNNLASQFGKTASAVLLRKVVPPHKVKDSISDIMVKLLSHTERLTVLVADVEADLRENTISITVGYSCLDRGKSTGKAIMWHVANDLDALSIINDSVGSASQWNSTTNVDRTASQTDISEQCWLGGADLTTPKFRQVETNGIHEGGGVFYKPIIKVDQRIDLSYEFFSTLLKRRKQADERKEVIYDEDTKIPNTLGLPFDTSVRVITPRNITNDKTTDYRVPATVHMSNRAHMGYRLAAANISPGESRTTGRLVALSVLSSGLAIVIATWVVFKSIADGAKERMYQLRRLGIRAIILGQGGIDLASRMFIVLQVLAGLILIAPMLQALFEGVADPRPSVEVTTIATVFYSRSFPEEETMSDDRNNFLAGAAFQILVTTSMRQLDEGFYTEFIVALVSVIAASIAVAMREMFRLACMMPCCDDLYKGVSFWNTLGFFRLKYAPRRADVAAIDIQRRYRAFVEFRDDMKWEELEEIYCLLLTTASERQFATQPMNCKEELKEKGRRQIVAMQLRHALEEHVTPLQTFGLVASIRMRDKDRVAAMLAKCKPWYARLPRAWYWITAAGGIEANSVEWYRCTGVFMADGMLFAARLGLLDCLDKVKRISFRDATVVESKFDYVDGVKVELYEMARLDRHAPDFVGLADERAVQLEELGAVEVPKRFREGSLIQQSKLISVPPGFSIPSLSAHLIDVSKSQTVSGTSLTNFKI